MTGISHDDVVENVDFEKLACSDEVTGDFDIGLGWCRFSAYAACGISGVIPDAVLCRIAGSVHDCSGGAASPIRHKTMSGYSVLR